MNEIKGCPVHILVYGATYEEWHTAKIEWRQALRRRGTGSVLISGLVGCIDEMQTYLNIRKDVNIVSFVSHQRPARIRVEAEALADLIASVQNQPSIVLANKHLASVFQSRGLRVLEHPLDDCCLTTEKAA